MKDKLNEIVTNAQIEIQKVFINYGIEPLGEMQNEIYEIIEKHFITEVAKEMFEDIERNIEVIGSPYAEKQYCLSESRFLDLKKKYIGE